MAEEPGAAENSPENSSLSRPRFFGRRKGKPVTLYQQSAMKEALGRIGLSLDGETPGSLDPAALFGPGQAAAVWLEIGFGKGEHLAAQAQGHPAIGMIGCEPFLNGVARLATSCMEQNIGNIRIYPDDARPLLDALKEASIQRAFLLHPDPWPKNRHAERRFVNPENLDRLARVLADGGELRIGTDHPVYAAWTFQQMQARPDFAWIAESRSDWEKRPDDWPETRYARKALEGAPVYLRFRRLPRP